MTSLRRLYKSIPKENRLCQWCGNPILRNIDGDKEIGIYHHGCLMDAKDAKFRCLDCLNFLDGTQVSKIDFQDGFGSRFTCGNCGSTNLKKMK